MDFKNTALNYKKYGLYLIYIISICCFDYRVTVDRSMPRYSPVFRPMVKSSLFKIFAEYQVGRVWLQDVMTSSRFILLRRQIKASRWM